VRSHPGTRHDQAYLVTEAQQSRSAEISQRQRRYLVMMGIRVVCFVVTVVMFLNHLGWLSLIPAAGAILLPYFAVVVANSRDPRSSAGFQAYEPRLPDRFSVTNGSSGVSGAPRPAGDATGGSPGTAAGSSGPAGEPVDE
jgi:Protein of unknown function (DUF3099)